MDDVDLEKAVSPSSDSAAAAAASLADDGRLHPQCTCGSGPVNSCSRHYTFGLPDTTVGAMILVSLLFAAVAAALLRWAPHPAEPLPLEQAVPVVWKVSLLACSYLGLWTYTFSRTMGAAAVFLRATYAAALACAAGVVAGPVSGVAAAHLCTAWAAGMLGYALAEHRVHVGAERAAAEAAARTPSSPSSLTEDQKLTAVNGVFVMGTMTVFLGARVAWLVLLPGGGGYRGENAWFAVVELSALTFFGIFLWAMFAAFFLLREALVLLESLLRASFCCWACSALGTLGIMVSHWVWVYVLGTEMMAMAAFLGYALAVNARCREILASEWRRQLCLADLGDDDDGDSTCRRGHTGGNR